jgi:hypothetical protein
VAVLVRALLGAHLLLAFLATGAFWIPAFTPKGGPRHRAGGRWFARFIYGAAATGGVLAIIGLIHPAFMLRSGPELSAAGTRRVMWLILYFLLLIVTPVQHGLAAVAAGARPAAIRSRVHAGLNVLSVAAAFLFFPAAIAWQAWPFLVVAPAGFVIGLRNMTYASRPAASAAEWEIEHLTSLLTAGIALHTAFFVLSALRWPIGTPAGGWGLWPWLTRGVVGLPAIVWLRRTVRRRPQFAAASPRPRPVR